MKWLAPLLILLFVLSACNDARRADTDASGEHAPACPEQPAAEETASALLSCLAAAAGGEQAEALLRRWGRVGDEWGGVMAVGLLPGGGEELAISYHRDLTEVIWNPQGRLLLLKQGAGGWEIAFDSAGLQPVRPDGQPWQNWAYRLVANGDTTGDGRADLLLELRFSNGHNVNFTRHALLAAHDGSVPTLHLLPSNQYGSYRIDDARAPLVFTANLQGRRPITRTYAFDGRTFNRVEERIDPAQATATVRLPGGATWMTFDSAPHIGAVPCGSLSGLYRLHEGALEHFSLPQAVRVLEAGPDGALYVGTGCGVLRYRGETVTELAAPHCGDGPLAGSAPVTDIALDETGTIWAGAPFALFRYDDAWERYDVNASRVLLAPDGSVWTAGWDGRADSGCCLTHLDGGSTVTYTYAAPLPAPPALEKALRALAPDG